MYRSQNKSIDETHPEVVAEWHPDKNGGIKASNLTRGSHQKIWWLCKMCGHEWCSAVYTRIHNVSGCPKCGRKKAAVAQTITTSEFIKRAISKHGDRYDYSITEYTRATIDVDIICHKHGMFTQRAHDHLNGNGCRKCDQEKKTLSGHPRWAGCGELRGNYWCNVRLNAQKRSLAFEVTIEQGWDLFIEQNGRCALTGAALIMAAGSKQTASLDRIDSKKGYIAGNLQWVHKRIQQAKWDTSQEQFVQMCIDVAKHVATC